MRASLLMLWSLPWVLPACGCDPVDCPEGATYDGYRCVPDDGGAADGEAGTDGGHADASPDRDAGPETDAGGRDAGEAGPADGGPDACVPSAEICNGVDDDCDGAIDEGLQGPVGEPVELTGGPGNFGLRIAALEAWADGYIAIWTEDDGLIRYRLLDRNGTPTAGTRRIDDRTISPPEDIQEAPDVAIVGDRAVVVWEQSGVVRGRSIPLDGTSPPGVVDLAGTESPASFPNIVRVDTLAMVTWFAEVEIEHHALLVDEGLTPTGGRARIYDYQRTTVPKEPAAALVHVHPPGSDPYVLVGVVDERAGDGGDRVYVGRVQPAGLIVESTWYPLGDVSVDESVAAVGIEDDVAAIVTASRDSFGGAQRADVHVLATGRAGTELGAPESSNVSDGRFVAGTCLSSAGGVTDVAVAEIVVTGVESAYATVSPEGTLAGGTSVPAAALFHGCGRIDATTAGMLMLSLSVGSRVLVFQSIGCSP